ncbi:LysR family transcriptional regulator [Conexibacter sp. SYSU D00693]|uniref:LysR family transcriptional regulator n=1 Tax=Conexibacter sp. SYSU D00693 TaxID=2812560 RepID=UPI00196A30F5|nr:LysR family transcriptional regulator [Conexibacter sp. SYSU D00693]
MLDLRRLRLLRELAERGTVTAVADALQYSPSAVSQQLAVLEREAGVPLVERAGRGVRLTDAARVLVAHAEALLDRAALAEAELAAAGGAPVGRARIAAFQSVFKRLAIPALGLLRDRAPALRAEVHEAEPEDALPALALGDFDLVLADEWDHQPRPRLAGVHREDLLRDPVHVVLPAGHRLAGEDPAARVALADLRDEPWTTGQPGTGYAAMTVRACRELGGFEPDLRHRANDATVLLDLVAEGHAVTLLPAFVQPEDRARVAVRPIAEGDVGRTIFCATRAADEARPSVRVLREAMRDVASA